MSSGSGGSRGSRGGGRNKEGDKESKKSVPSAVMDLFGSEVDIRDQLYKNRSSRKIDSRRLFTREYDFLKTFSLTENQFSGKTYFYTIASRSRAEAPFAVTDEYSQTLLQPALVQYFVRQHAA